MMKMIYSKDAKADLPKPIYAAAGAGELAYEQLRKLPEVAARTIRTAGHAADEWRQRINLNNDTVTARVRESAERGRVAMRSTAAVAQQQAAAASERAAAGYQRLVARGEKFIAERRAEASHEEPAKVEVIVGKPEPAASGSGKQSGGSKPAADQPAAN